jgi:phosphate transport system substrate-binding protein
MRKLLTLAACGVLALGAAACGSDDDNSDSSGSSSSGGKDLSGTIKIDGSSTVAPFAQAAQ